MATNSELKPCPSCKSDNIIHRCFSHIPNTSEFNKNGWYCSECGNGPFSQFTSELDAAKFAAALLCDSEAHHEE